ncbi:putative RNA-directed DNA polymerase from transposon X-element [Trichonephila clavipes]|nr:putative RNA-directed DNA polymerase from transposon X-element [Trichonephila clavipes]
MRSGDLFLEVSSSNQATVLIKLQKLAHLDITVAPHNNLNFSRGVISPADFLNVSIEEIKENIKAQKVCDVRRITIRRDGQVLNTKHLILTFSTPDLPQTVKMAYIRCPRFAEKTKKQKGSRDQRLTLARIPRKISRDFHRKIEQDTLIGDGSEEDEALMDIQSGPSTSSSGGGANDNTSPTGGVCLFTSNLYHSNIVTLPTSLQAVAVRIHIHSLVSVCCVYLPPNDVVPQVDLNQLVSQLPAPFILLGDFNGHSPLWGHDDTNSRGRQIEQLISDHCLFLLNNDEKTYFHSPTRTFHSLDLAICSPVLQPMLNFEVEKDLHNSDQFPLLVSQVNVAGTRFRPPTYHYHRVDWDKCTRLAIITSTMGQDRVVDEAVFNVTKAIWNASDAAIPKTSNFPRKRYPTTDNLIAFKSAKALARRIRRQCQRESWIKYVSSITSSSTSQQLWRKVKAANGLYREFNIPILETSTALYSSPLDVANLIGQTFASLASSDSYSPVFQATKNRLERTPINFMCRQSLPYNCDFDTFELKRALSSGHNTSPGPDGISYELLRHLNKDSLVSLIYLFNRIWREQVYPTQWQEAIVIPILKPGKDPKNPLSYQPIALTSCLCKALERMASLYVDDLQFSCEGSDMRMIEWQLQTAVNTIVKWCDSNGHSISASKSCCVHFCRKRGIHHDPEIRIRDVQIPVVPDVRFLGVIFDRRLTFLPHILQLRKSKSTVVPDVFQRVFAYHRSQYSRNSSIYTDDSKRADYVGCGVVIEDVTHGYRLDPSCSVFTAEAVAIYRALQSIDSNMPHKYCIYTDSMSVLEVLENYNDRCHPVVCNVLNITSRLHSKGFDIVFFWIPSHVGIIGNEQMDNVARSATTHVPLAVPLSDIKRVIPHHIFKIWQESWSHPMDNKLHSMKPVIRAWPVMPMRRTDVKLTRLRIGHTRFTHRHLLLGEDVSECLSFHSNLGGCLTSRHKGSQKRSIGHKSWDHTGQGRIVTVRRQSYDSLAMRIQSLSG